MESDYTVLCFFNTSLRRNKTGRGRRTIGLQRKPNFSMGLRPEGFVLNLWQNNIVCNRLGMGSRLLSEFTFLSAFRIRKFSVRSYLDLDLATVGSFQSYV